MRRPGTPGVQTRSRTGSNWGRHVTGYLTPDAFLQKPLHDLVVRDQRRGRRLETTGLEAFRLRGSLSPRSADQQRGFRHAGRWTLMPHTQRVPGITFAHVRANFACRALCLATNVPPSRTGGTGPPGSPSLGGRIGRYSFSCHDRCSVLSVGRTQTSSRESACSVRQRAPRSLAGCTRRVRTSRAGDSQSSTRGTPEGVEGTRDLSPDWRLPCSR